MAYRLSYPARSALHVTTTVTDPGPAYTAVGDRTLTTKQFQFFAVDSVPLDTEDHFDHLTFQTTLTDDTDAQWTIVGREAQRSGENQLFGGVLSNQYVRRDDGMWSLQPLKAWGMFDVSVDGDEVLTDTFGVATLTTVPDRLKLTLFPRPVQKEAVGVKPDVTFDSPPLHFEWKNTPYLQVPTVTVRAEKNDTLKLIADDMGVDMAAIVATNADVAGAEDPLHGHLITVPLIPKKLKEQPKIAPSFSLTWDEIVHGWSMRN